MWTCEGCFNIAADQEQPAIAGQLLYGSGLFRRIRHPATPSKMWDVLDKVLSIQTRPPTNRTYRSCGVHASMAQTWAGSTEGTVTILDGGFLSCG